MKELSIRISEYFNFLWDASCAIINGYFFKRYPEIGTYVHPNGAASTLLAASHYAVLRQRDELFGADGEFDEYAKDAAEIDKYVESYINNGAGANGLPTDLYKKLIQSMEASIIPESMWLLSDLGGGGKKGRVVAIHAQIGNYIASSFFRKRGASMKELGDASNVISRLFAVCYTKYAETLGFNEEDYDETLQPQEEDNEPRERPVIDSISSPEHPFVSSLVEHITSDELRSYGHEPPKVGSPIYWAMEYFDDYFRQMNARVPKLTEDDVYHFSESIYEYVLRYAPAVSKKHLDNRVDYVWAYGLRKGEMVIDILKETIGDEQFNVVESEILSLTNKFIDKFLAVNCGEDDFNDDLYD